MGGKQKQPDAQENLRILATQIETINQQLSSGGAGGGGGPALTTAMEQVEGKINYLYEFVKGMQAELNEAQQEYFGQIGNQVTGALNTNLTQLFGKLQEMAGSLQSIQENLINSPSIQAKDIAEMKQTLASLIDVYKDEVKVFKEQNEFLQKRLSTIEKKIDAKK